MQAPGVENLVSKGISVEALGLLGGPVLAASLAASLDSFCVQSAADHVVPDSGQVLYPAPPDQYDGVLLQVVAFPANIGGYFDSIGQSNAADFAQR
jgi:hypothetical protein